MWRIFALGGYKIWSTPWGRYKVQLWGFDNHIYIMSVTSTHEEIARSCPGHQPQYTWEELFLLAAKLDGEKNPSSNSIFAAKSNWEPNSPTHWHTLYGRSSVPGADSFFAAHISPNCFLHNVHCISSRALWTNREWSRRIGPVNRLIVLQLFRPHISRIWRQIHLHLPTDGPIRLSPHEAWAVCLGHI